MKCKFSCISCLLQELDVRLQIKTYDAIIYFYFIVDFSLAEHHRADRIKQKKIMNRPQDAIFHYVCSFMCQEQRMEKVKRKVIKMISLSLLEIFEKDYRSKIYCQTQIVLSISEKGNLFYAKQKAFD